MKGIGKGVVVALKEVRVSYVQRGNAQPENSLGYGEKRGRVSGIERGKGNENKNKGGEILRVFKLGVNGGQRKGILAAAVDRQTETIAHTMEKRSIVCITNWVTMGSVQLNTLCARSIRCAKRPKLLCRSVRESLEALTFSGGIEILG